MNMDENPEQPMTEDEKKKAFIKEAISFAGVIVAAILLALIWNKVITAKIECISGSMMDTLQIDDRFIANRLAYVFGEPKRGDIVVFHFPDDESETYIKRLMGLPGETLEIKDGYLYIDDVLYEEDYIKGERKGNFGPYMVPEGEYFMLGDNRNHSGDSREWKDKYVSKDQIIGKAWFLYKPKFRWL